MAIHHRIPELRSLDPEERERVLSGIRFGLLLKDPLFWVPWGLQLLGLFLYIGIMSGRPFYFTGLIVYILVTAHIARTFHDMAIRKQVVAILGQQFPDDPPADE